MTTQIALTLKSRNRKVGPIPVSTTTSKTCPTSCPFKGNGCYAEAGPLALFWRKVDREQAGTDWDQFLAKVKDLKNGQLWRHNQAGDLPGTGDDIDPGMLAELIGANKGKRGFTYTHKPMETEINRACVEQANKQGFTVNLSANTTKEADQLADLNIGPVVCVLPIDQTANSKTPKGRKVVVCPASIKDNVSCNSCQLCQRQRDFVIGFPAHGNGKRKAEAVALAE